ncbi:MAG: hypothetical protein ABUL60_11825 [Myxococcales bacterium]
MRRAAPSSWVKKPSLVRSSRRLAAWFVLGACGACSVYSNDLLETASGVTNGGSDSSGNGGALAGNPTTVAGTSSAGTSGAGTPGAGGDGEGGEPGTGMAGADTGGTNTMAGSANTAGGGTGGTSGGGTSGGTGGASGTGGSGGFPVDINLIDDFEDQNLTIKASDTRGGVWYLFDNGTTGTTGPKPLACAANVGAPAALGDYALRITATGFTGTADSVGSGLGVDFRNQRKVYDGSKFTGIRFWAKVGAGKNTTHRVQIADATTDKAGGKCSSAAGKLCDDHFGIAQTFTTTWAQYTVRFDKLTQLGWGNSADALDTAALYGLQITAAPKLDVDLWLDQLEFF